MVSQYKVDKDRDIPPEYEQSSQLACIDNNAHALRWDYHAILQDDLKQEAEIINVSSTPKEIYHLSLFSGLVRNVVIKHCTIHSDNWNTSSFSLSHIITNIQIWKKSVTIFLAKKTQENINVGLVLPQVLCSVTVTWHWIGESPGNRVTLFCADIVASLPLIVAQNNHYFSSAILREYLKCWWWNPVLYDVLLLSMTASCHRHQVEHKINKGLFSCSHIPTCNCIETF